MVTDDSGAVVSAFNYDAYGAVRQSAGEARSFAYAGEQTDESALAFLRARSYDPTMGRFLQRDSLPVGNRYAYVAGNPLRYVDPSGHREVELSEIPNWIHDEDWDSINNETLRGNAKGYYFDDLEALTNDNPFDKLGFGLSFLAGGSLKVGTGGLAVLGSLRSGLARGPSALTECATAGLSSATGSITTTLASRALSGKQAQVVLNK